MKATQLPLFTQVTEKKWMQQVVPEIVEKAHGQPRNIPTVVRMVLREPNLPIVVVGRWVVLYDTLVRKARCRINEARRKENLRRSFENTRVRA